MMPITNYSKIFQKKIDLQFKNPRDTQNHYRYQMCDDYLYLLVTFLITTFIIELKERFELIFTLDILSWNMFPGILYES